MMPLTATTPKPLLKVAGRALIDYTMDLLPEGVDEVIVVVNYLGQQIIDYLLKNYPNREFRFIWQEAITGNLKALELARPYLGDDKFLVFPADDLQSREAVAECSKHDLALLVSESAHPERFGVVMLKKKVPTPPGTMGEIDRIIEKPANPQSNLVNMMVHIFDKRIFNYNVKPQPNGEYYITDAITELIKDYPVLAIKTDFWMPIGYPDDLKKAEAALLK